MENLMVKNETTNTIKGIEVIGYKCMNSDMTCRGFQYELGKTYKTDKVELSKCGFHACLSPQDTFIFYSQGKKSRYFKVKLSGEIAKCGFVDTNVAATEITILEEITDNINEIIETTEWWKHDNVLDLLYFSDGLARLNNRKRQCNFINKDGKFVSDQWYKFADIYRHGFAKVVREDELQNYIDKDGKLLSKQWFEWADDFKDGLAMVIKVNRKYNYIDKDGKLLSKQWFEWVDDFKDDLAIVQRANGKYNYIDKEGKLLSKEWFRWANDFKNGIANVQRTNGDYCNIDKQGKIVVRK